MTNERLYGLTAEFDNPTALVEAARRLSEAGYYRMEAYTPFPVKEVSQYITVRRPVMPLVIFAADSWAG